MADGLEENILITQYYSTFDDVNDLKKKKTFDDENNKHI